MEDVKAILNSKEIQKISKGTSGTSGLGESLTTTRGRYERKDSKKNLSRSKSKNKDKNYFFCKKEG